MTRKSTAASAWRRSLLLASAMVWGAVELVALQRARLRAGQTD